MHLLFPNIKNFTGFFKNKKTAMAKMFKSCYIWRKLFIYYLVSKQYNIYNISLTK